MALSMSTSEAKLNERKTGVESFSLSNTQNVTRSAETARVNKSDSRANEGFASCRPRSDVTQRLTKVTLLLTSVCFSAPNHGSRGFCLFISILFPSI